ncbi:Glycosyl transferase family 11 [Prevotella sp. khp7]|uniref:alpha-1,2-fucosyltransferase n=1 Tax=Prevotella sp. khp7 TaxID=1761885 RepID=UPI0008CA4B13|nr:alpha-1,2-fucosyltransferase [Prevotella sp. khp7]SEW14048.1 Glycosyl transferase family 11 [Prevotella sp. khp7]
MKIVRISGGLGNQMFQFALYEALRRQHPEEEMLVDLHGFIGYKKHRGFELPKVFHVAYEEATLGEIAKVAYPYPNYQSWRILSRVLPCRKTMLKEKPDFSLEPEALTRPGDTYYDGYWQHEEYFDRISGDIVRLYHFPDFENDKNQLVGKMALETNSCAIHIRRGDYLTDPLRQGTTSLDFPLRAIKWMKENRAPEQWLVFSDDMPLARECLKAVLPEEKTCYVDWNQGIRSINDMHLMSLCKNHIIANSTFSWWGAWLCQREDKTVVAPHEWMNRKNVVSPAVKDWIKL